MPSTITREEAVQHVARVDSTVLRDIIDGWRSAGEPAALRAAARRELVRRHPCVDCGVIAGTECLPEYGCTSSSRRWINDAPDCYCCVPGCGERLDYGSCPVHDRDPA